MNKIRTFIAVDLPFQIKEKIASLQTDLKSSQCKIAWVKPENIHLTLKFLGNVEEQLIERIEQGIRVAAGKITPFTLEVKGVGAFPNFSKAKVIWIGAVRDTAILNQLAESIDNQMHLLGFENENRYFKAHFTIGRVKSAKGINTVIDKIQHNSNFNAGSFQVNEILIMRSDLKPSGAEYSQLKSIQMYH